MKFPLISAFLVVLLLSNCASKLTESQKSSLSQVMLNQPIIESGDLKPIDGKESPNASSSVPMSTGGGALPALIGCAIDAGVTKYQAGQFKKQYGSQIEQVQAHVPRNPGNDLHRRATKVLRNDEFFKSRLSASGAPNRIDCDLISYGLVRSSHSQDQTYLGMKITCKVWLTDSKGKADS